MIETVFLGVIVSGSVQWLKGKFATDKAGTLLIVAGASFVIAVGIYFLQNFNLWQTFLGILASAAAVYAFIIQHFEDVSPLVSSEPSK